MEKINENAAAVEIERGSEQYLELRREYHDWEHKKIIEFGRFVEKLLPAKEWYGYGIPSAANFTDSNNAENFRDMAEDAGFRVRIIESGKRDEKPWTRVHSKNSFEDFLVEKGLKVKGETKQIL